MLSNVENPVTTIDESEQRRICASKKFAAAYQEWLAAKSELAGLETLPDDIPDEATTRLNDRETQSERDLAQVPAIQPYQLFQKFWAFHAMIANAEHDGYPTDRRHLIMLASLEADLYRFEITSRDAE